MLANIGIKLDELNSLKMTPLLAMRADLASISPLAVSAVQEIFEADTLLKFAR